MCGAVQGGWEKSCSTKENEKEKEKREIEIERDSWSTGFAAFHGSLDSVGATLGEGGLALFGHGVSPIGRAAAAARLILSLS